MRFLSLLMLTAQGAVSDQQCDPNDDDWGGCTTDWCAYYNDQSRDACVREFSTKDKDPNWYCQWGTWIDGPCESNPATGCPALASSGECWYDCWATDDDSDMYDVYWMSYELWWRFGHTVAF